MLIEATLQDLLTSTNQIDTTARQHVSNEVQIIGGFQVIAIGRDLVFQGRTSTGHVPKIRMVDIEQIDAPTATLLATTSGEQLYIDPIPHTNQTYVSCDCEDFVYRFATTDQQRGVLFGKITRPTIPKTDRPSQNLGKIGMCKHLLKLISVLKSERVIE